MAREIVAKSHGQLLSHGGVNVLVVGVHVHLLVILCGFGSW